MNKPNGATVVALTFEDSKRFIQGMPTRRVPGIGRVLEKILRQALRCSIILYFGLVSLTLGPQRGSGLQQHG